MTLLDLSQLRPVLETATQDLFRWETLPAYEVASDGSDYRRYLDGAHAPTTARKQPWLDTLRAWAEQGRPRRRVRIIDLADTSLPPELTRIAGDFWLVDDREVVAMYYQPDGQFRAAEILEPQHVAEYHTAAEVSWELDHSTTARPTEWSDDTAHQLEQQPGPP